MLTTEAKKLCEQIYYAVGREFELKAKELCKHLSWKTVTDEEIAELHRKMDELIEDYRARDLLITDIAGVRSISYTRDITVYIHRDGVSSWRHEVPEIDKLNEECEKKKRKLQDIVWSYPDEEQLKTVLEYLSMWKNEIRCY